MLASRKFPYHSEQFFKLFLTGLLVLFKIEGTMISIQVEPAQGGWRKFPGLRSVTL